MFYITAEQHSINNTLCEYGAESENLGSRKTRRLLNVEGGVEQTQCSRFDYMYWRVIIIHFLKLVSTLHQLYLMQFIASKKANWVLGNNELKYEVTRNCIIRELPSKSTWVSCDMTRSY